jgi:hypothetical protein
MRFRRGKLPVRATRSEKDLRARIKPFCAALRCLATLFG